MVLETDSPFSADKEENQCVKFPHLRADPTENGGSFLFDPQLELRASITTLIREKGKIWGERRF